MDELGRRFDVVVDFSACSPFCSEFRELCHRNVVRLRWSRRNESHLGSEQRRFWLDVQSRPCRLLTGTWEYVMRRHFERRPGRISIALLVVAVVLGILAGDLTAKPASAAASIARTRTVFRHGVRSALRTAHTSGTPVYSPGELYGGTDSVALCFTCEASDITGTAPPSASLDAGSGVNNLTGDYSYSLELFNSPGFGSTMSDALTYDAQLAQSQIAKS